MTSAEATIQTEEYLQDSMIKVLEAMEPNE